MTALSVYKVVKHEKFETSYRALIKNHYRKNDRGKAKLEKLILDFLKELESNPKPDGALPEPRPSSSSKGFPANTEFIKMRWRNLPELYSSAAFGRLLYVVFHDKRIIIPFWIYTHEEFGAPKSRPPDKEMMICIKEIIDDYNLNVYDLCN